MNRIKTLTVSLLCLASAVSFAQKPMAEVIEESLSLCRTQSLILARTLAPQEAVLPRSFADGKLVTSDYSWWCSGFFPGVLWQLYGDRPYEELRRYAVLFTDRVEPAKKMTNTHDLGFMLYCSFGQGYRLTGESRYLDVIREGTESLLTRYDGNLGVIKSWEPNKKWKYPVIIDNMMNLAEGSLKKNFPFESLSDDPDRREVSYLEAVGRTLCGIAPWLELGPDSSPEGQLRAQMLDWTLKGLKNAVDPKSPDYLRFSENRHRQPLVDAAFLAEGLLRAPTQLWGRLDSTTRQNLITELKRSRAITPYESNWLLFASIIEAALLEFDGQCDTQRLFYGVDKFLDGWYKGDGWYGDGAEFHLDYYNSLVIHPMLTAVLQVCRKHGLRSGDQLMAQQARQGRYAAQMERLISPEGTYPAVGRSITYRFGSFHAMSDAALLHLLPEDLNPAQLRCALTAVIRRQLGEENTFDGHGWLRVGFTGSQIRMSEEYINSGSEYLCCAAFCALGLPASDPFWSNPYADWTSRKAWLNREVPADHSLRER